MRATLMDDVIVESGAIMRSTDECDMSRSCQRATFSSAGTTAARTEASPALSPDGKQVAFVSYRLVR